MGYCDVPWARGTVFVGESTSFVAQLAPVVRASAARELPPEHSPETESCVDGRLCRCWTRRSSPSVAAASRATTVPRAQELGGELEPLLVRRGLPVRPERSGLGRPGARSSFSHHVWRVAAARPLAPEKRRQLLPVAARPPPAPARWATSRSSLRSPSTTGTAACPPPSTTRRSSGTPRTGTASRRTPWRCGRRTGPRCRSSRRRRRARRRGGAQRRRRGPPWTRTRRTGISSSCPRGKGARATGTGTRRPTSNRKEVSRRKAGPTVEKKSRPPREEVRACRRRRCASYRPRRRQPVTTSPLGTSGSGSSAAHAPMSIIPPNAKGAAKTQRRSSTARAPPRPQHTASP